VRPTQTQDREVNWPCRDPRFIAVKGSGNLKSRRGSLALEEGGQGVLLHRKQQGCVQIPGTRQDVRALAIVSKTSRLIS
jgi:hypothetical protein